MLLRVTRYYARPLLLIRHVDMPRPVTPCRLRLRRHMITIIDAAIIFRA